MNDKYIIKCVHLPANASVAVEPSPDVLQQIRHFVGLDGDTADTKSLALVAFLYLYCCISSTDRCVFVYFTT